MRKDLRKISRQDYRRLFKIAVDDKEELDKKEETENKESEDKEQNKSEEKDNSDLGKDTPEQKEEESKDEDEELKQQPQVDNPNQEPQNKELIEHSIEQISNSGRSLLKEIEKFKFNLEQTSRMLSQIPQLSQGMMSKRKSVNEISNKLYQIIFDIENTDISLSFQQENPEATDIVRNDTRSVGEPKPQMPSSGAPGGGPIPPNPNLNKKDEDEEDTGKEDEDKNDEDTDDEE